MTHFELVSILIADGALIQARAEIVADRNYARVMRRERKLTNDQEAQLLLDIDMIEYELQMPQLLAA